MLAGRNADLYEFLTDRPQCSQIGRTEFTGCQTCTTPLQGCEGGQHLIIMKTHSWGSPPRYSIGVNIVFNRDIPYMYLEPEG